MTEVNDKQKLVIDPKPAAVVRRIFQMVIDGNGLRQIADALCAEKILIPSAYATKYYPENRHCKDYHDPYRWSGTEIGRILSKQEYMGHTVLGKTVSESYKTKKRRNAAPDELMIFKNTHPAIVDEETWNNAQRLRKTIRKLGKGENQPYRLTGLLYCADCGAKMTHRQRSKGFQKYDADNAYVCSAYRQLTRDCTMHYIRVSVVEKLILEAIRRVSSYVRKSESEFVQQVCKASSVQQEKAVKNCKKQLEQSQKRHDELDMLVKKLYESYATGKLPDRQFERLLSEYDKEQADLENMIQALQFKIDGFNADNVKTDKFIQLVKRYTDFTELTTPMLNEFVEKVVVHEAEKATGERVQKVDIYFNFIGQFDIDVPDDQLSPSQLEKERKRRERNSRERDANRERMRQSRKKQRNEKAAVNY